MAQASDRTKPPTRLSRRPRRSTSAPLVAGRSGRKTDASGKRKDNAIVAEVGLRLKQLRTVAGLTLEGLAAKSGVSRAMLSKVERGEKSPTLTVFVRIAAGLNVSLSTLMGAEPDFAEAVIIRAAERLTFKDPETGFERHVLSPKHVDNGVELLLHRIPPGKSSGMLPPYNVPTEKLLTVHEGQLTVHTGKSRYDLRSGDSLFFEVREPYRFVNTGKTRCAYYLVIVPRR